MSRFASDQHRYPVDKINPFIPIINPLPGEYWKEITDIAAPKILPYYAISNYGRIVHIFNNSYMSQAWDGAGYSIVLLRTFDGTKTFRVHRLMMLTFRYFDGCEEFVVDHINGDKKANYLDFPVFNINTGLYELQDNLRWATQSQNITYAKNGQVEFPPKSNDYRYKKVVTEEIVHEICKLLQDGSLSFAQIADVTGTNLGIVQNIRFGRSWYSISCNYYFPDKSRYRRGLSDDIINDICKDLENKERMTDISKKYGVFIDVVKGIKYRKTYTDISKKYNF